jgi:sporulation protein YlmC with PRC-barrel domain
MKKFSLIFTFLLVGALVLTACAGDGADQNQNGVNTPGAGDGAGLITPEATTPVEEAPGGELEATEAPDLGADDPAATPAVDLTATPAAGTGSTGDGQIPSTGASETYVLLSDLMGMQVQDMNGEQIGAVEGVLVDRSMGAAGAGGIHTSSTGVGVTTTEGTTDMSGNSASGSTVTQEEINNANNDANSGATTGQDAGNAGAGTTGDSDATGTTGAANDGAANDGANTTSSSLVDTAVNPIVRYVVISLQNTAGSEAAGSEAAGSDAAGSEAAGTTTGTGGNQVLVPWMALAHPSATANATSETDAASQQDVLVLMIDATILTDAPRFDGQASSVGPDVAQYWGDPTLGIPATGAEGSGTNGEMDETSASLTVIGSDSLNDVRINGSDNQELGQVRDFIVDRMTGELRYAVLGGGTAFTGNLYVVPFRSLTWNTTDGESMGAFQMNNTGDAFSSAPSVASEDAMQMDDAWLDDVNTYWDGQTAGEADGSQ